MKPFGNLSVTAQANVLTQRLEKLGIASPGLHPYTKEPFIEGTIEAHHDSQMYHALAPGRPSPVRSLYDEYGDFVRDEPIPKKEYRKLLAHWEKAMAEWKKTGGMWKKITSPPHITGYFKTDSGSIVEGDYIEETKTWRWTIVVS